MDSMGALPLIMFPHAVSTCHAVRLGRDSWDDIAYLDAVKQIFIPKNRARNSPGPMNKTSSRRLCFACPEPRLQFVDLLPQSFRQMRTELGKVFPDERDFPEPSLNIHAQQFRNLFRGQVQPARVQVFGPRQTADGRILGLNLAIAALEDPFQYPAVFAISRPQELAVLIGAEPVHVVNAWQLRAWSSPDFQIVSEVVAHVIAAEGQHGHRVAPQLSDSSRGGGSGFAAGGRAQKCSVLPAE